MLFVVYVATIMLDKVGLALLFLLDEGIWGSLSTLVSGYMFAPRRPLPPPPPCPSPCPVVWLWVGSWVQGFWASVFCFLLVVFGFGLRV